jgi:hypothetical protein
MANTVTRAAQRTTGGAQQAGRELGHRVAGGAARKMMSEAGSVVLGAVVDMAVSRVDRVAARLDGVAESGGTGLRGALTGRPAKAMSDRKPADEGGTAVRALVGAAFSLVVSSAIKLLQFLQRLALQLLEALRRLARRPRTALPEPEAAPRSDAPDPKPGRSGPAEPAVRRRRPAPPPTQARRR